MALKGFFSADTIAASKNEDVVETGGCLKCGLYKKCITPKMKYTGKGKKKVLIIAEASGNSEDKQGIQLIGESGQLLRNYLTREGLDLDEDFWKVNSVNCRPTTADGKNRKPTKTEIKCCKPIVDQVIKELKPEYIWLMGGVAVESMLMDRFSDTSISRWVGLAIPDPNTKAWILPMYHPSYVLRREYDENLKSEFVRNLKHAISYIGKGSYTHDNLREHVHLINTFDTVINLLRRLLEDADTGEMCLYLDYETNSLKAQWGGCKIATVSLAVSENEAYAFPFQRAGCFNETEIRKIKSLLRKVFTHPNILLMAHNMKFEDSWTRNIIGVKPDWFWDTMIGAHLIDNRRKFSGLKFQSFIQLGVNPYDKAIKKYLQAKPGTHFNEVDKAPLKELLEYNAYDTLLGFRLFLQQKPIFEEELGYNAYDLFHDGSLALSDVHENGFCIKPGYYEKEEVRINKEIATIREELLSSEEHSLWLEKHLKPLNLNSNKELGKFFYEVLGETPVLTDNDNYKVDKATIETMDRPFVAKLLQMRKLEKVVGTYFAQIKREICNGKLHPFYDLHIPRSFRSSSSLPNGQNMPKHDKIAGRIVRLGIIPPESFYIAESDFSSIEVKIAALATQDPSLLKYVTDPTTDMHRDAACDIWLIDKDQVTKSIRYASKGGWVFSQFYGSYYKNCAEDLWKACIITPEELSDGTPMIEHLNSKGIKTKDEFIEHLKNVEDIFWNKRFKVYKQWKLDMNKQYRRQGYIENFQGFRFVGYMTDKEVTNYPIQSSAFHILLESLIEVNRIAHEEKWRSHIIGQIHDSIISHIYKEEKDHVLKTINEVMTQIVPGRHEWITIPIGVEIEISDESWWDVKEITL